MNKRCGIEYDYSQMVTTYHQQSTWFRLMARILAFVALLSVSCSASFVVAWSSSHCPRCSVGNLLVSNRSGNPFAVFQCDPAKIHPHLTPRRKVGNFKVSPLWNNLSSEALTAWWSMTLLALQFACQPILTKTFAPKELVRTTYVLAGDLIRFALCAVVLTANSSWSSVAHQWCPMDTLLGAGIPAALYSIQNYCSLMAYQYLPPVSYNVLNQTKTLSAAIFCYFLLGKPQSKPQILSLLLLLNSVLIIERIFPIRKTAGHSTAEATHIEKRAKEKEFAMGVVPILLASLISGLAGALCQKALQTRGRDPYFFSMELSACSSMFLLLSLVMGNPDSEKIGKVGITHGWTKTTWIPLFFNAIGGILVGVVTKYAGTVRKGKMVNTGSIICILENKEHVLPIGL